MLIVYWSGCPGQIARMSPERNTGCGLFKPWQERTKQCFEPHAWSPRQASPNIVHFWRSPTRSPIDDLGTNLDRRDSKRSDYRFFSFLYNGLNLIHYLQLQRPSSTSSIDKAHNALYIYLFVARPSQWDEVGHHRHPGCGWRQIILQSWPANVPSLCSCSFQGIHLLKCFRT